MNLPLSVDSERLNRLVTAPAIEPEHILRTRALIRSHPLAFPVSIQESTSSYVIVIDDS